MKTILIVDDDQGLLDCLQQALMLLNYRVIPAQGAEAALTVVSSGAEIDLVITDYQMPGMHGLDLIARLQRTAPAVPVIMCSAFADQELPGKARAVGASAFVEKPYRLHDLRGIVREVLDLPLQNRAGIQTRGNAWFQEDGTS